MEFFVFPLLVLLILQIWACTLPMFGHFGSYQAVNAMMAELFGAHGLSSFFEPRLFSIQDGQPALCLLYFPYSAWLARLAQLALHLSADLLPFLGRLFSVLATWLSATVLRSICLRINPNKNIANLAMLFFLLTPMVMITGSSLQNESWAILFTLLSTRFLLNLKDGTAEPSSWDILAAGLFLGIALTARIHFGFFLLPAIWLLFKSRNLVKGSVIYVAGVLVPVLLWLGWFYFLQHKYQASQTSIFIQSDEGRFALLDYLNNPEFYLRLLKQIMVFWTLPLFLFFISTKNFYKGRSFLLIWLLASGVVIPLLPQKVFDHPFYLMGGIPAFVLLTTPAAYTFLNARGRLMNFFLAAALLLSAVIFLRVEKLPSEAYQWKNQAHYIEKVIPSENFIALQHEQTAAMLFYVHRRGWGFDLNMEQKAIPSFIPLSRRNAQSHGYGNPIVWLQYLSSQGARWFVVTDRTQFESKKEFAEFVKSHYPLAAFSRSDVLIFNLEAHI